MAAILSGSQQFPQKMALFTCDLGSALRGGLFEHFGITAMAVEAVVRQLVG
jgi:hypothetical protein